MAFARLSERSQPLPFLSVVLSGRVAFVVSTCTYIGVGCERRLPFLKLVNPSQPIVAQARDPDRWRNTVI